MKPLTKVLRAFALLVAAIVIGDVLMFNFGYWGWLAYLPFGLFAGWNLGCSFQKLMEPRRERKRRERFDRFMRRTEGVDKFPHVTCPDCGLTTYNTHDVAHGYCGYCHNYTSEPMAWVEVWEWIESGKRPSVPSTRSRPAR